MQVTILVLVCLASGNARRAQMTTESAEPRSQKSVATVLLATTPKFGSSRLPTLSARVSPVDMGPTQSKQNVQQRVNRARKQKIGAPQSGITTLSADRRKVMDFTRVGLVGAVFSSLLTFAQNKKAFAAGTATATATTKGNALVSQLNERVATLEGELIEAAQYLKETEERATKAEAKLQETGGNQQIPVPVVGALGVLAVGEAAALAKANGETTELESNLTDTRAELAKANGETTQLASELSDTRAELAKANGETAQLSSELSDTRREMTTLREKIKTLEGDVSEACQVGDETSCRLQEAVAKLDETTEKLQSAEAREKAITAAKDDAAVQAEQDMNALKSELAASAAKVASQAQELEDQVAAKADVEARMKDGELAAEKNLQEAEERAKTAADQAEQDMNALRSELQGVKGELAEFVAKVASQTQELENLQEAEERAKTAADQAEQDMNALRFELQGVKSDFASSVAKVASQAQELKDKEASKADAEQDMNALRSELQGVKGELAAQKDFKARMEAAEEKANASKGAAATIAELLKKTSEDNRAASKKAADEIAYLRGEMAKLTEKADKEEKSQEPELVLDASE